jgi:hypothetical protein
VYAHHRGADDFGADEGLSGRLHAHDRHEGGNGRFLPIIFEPDILPPIIL